MAECQQPESEIEDEIGMGLFEKHILRVIEPSASEYPKRPVQADTILEEPLSVTVGMINGTRFVDVNGLRLLENLEMKVNILQACQLVIEWHQNLSPDKGGVDRKNVACKEVQENAPLLTVIEKQLQRSPIASDLDVSHNHTDPFHRLAKGVHLNLKLVGKELIVIVQKRHKLTLRNCDTGITGRSGSPSHFMTDVLNTFVAKRLHRLRGII